MAGNYQQGDIVLVALGEPPQEVMGHEQAYNRPCIIIQPYPSLGLAVIVPCTSKKTGNSHFTIVKLASGTGGLTMDSFALCHQVRSVSFDRIVKKMGSLDKISLLKIKTVLSDTLDL